MCENLSPSENCGNLLMVADAGAEGAGYVSP